MPKRARPAALQRKAPTAYVHHSEALPRTASLGPLPRAEQTADSHKEHSSLARCASRAGRRCIASLLTPAPRVNCSPGTEAQPLRRRRAPPRPQTREDVAPNTLLRKSAMKTNAHNFIHACHMNTLYVMIVLAKLIRAPVSSRRRPPLCYPSLALTWYQSVVKAGGERPSGVHMSDGACTRARPNVPRSPQAWSPPPSARRG